METIANIAQDEGGVVTVPYLCSKGYLTWLIGRNIDARPITREEWNGLRIFLEQGKTFDDWANEIFIQDITMYDTELHISGVTMHGLSENIQAIIYNLAYNMGTTKFNPRKWPRFFAALADGDWNSMAIELKYTDITRSCKLTDYWTDVPNRAERLYNSILEEIKA